MAVLVAVRRLQFVRELHLVLDSGRLMVVIL